ncbi:alpha-L-fucosidase [Chitinophagaceae bacterium LB-8]|uniref:alpha-L-fucosidase n=1 Tax=Paraflavisolibacter caeni TaxID=2982496 RepID=A0A9X2XSC6_9BACT|nr:alpha-L-fucosidase [Paraflavisolibacter caeni]MCU7547976.1 alpha-L-fucosidase [Paraflavisolibacter caeni]
MTKRFMHLLFGASVFMFQHTLPAEAQIKATSKETLPAAKSGMPQHDPPITRPLNTAIGEAGNDYGFDMAPETTLKVVEGAVKKIPSKLPPGPFKPSWKSLQANYQVPSWFVGAKFGLFMHWGLYSVPAYKSEWYEKHMYGNKDMIAWHSEHFGPQDKFGYKDFIPLFNQEKFDADAWAELFKKSGAKFVIPTAQHHDNFAMWDSKVTPYNAKQMGPKRDLIGELCKAVRKQGLKFGVSNHGIENFQFINPPADMLEQMKAEKADLFDPNWIGFYNVADRSDTACQNFLVNWFERNVELIDKYQPDMLWFDNGIDQRYLDPLKLQIAAYYYNRAKQWGKEVSISTKKAAFAPAGTNITTIGSILDFEGRIPPGIRTGVWQVDSKIGSTWGYTSDMGVASAASIIGTLVDIVSKNGTLLLNLSPKADGVIPQEQQETLLDIGKWLDVNGDAIYGTHNWIQFGEDGPHKIRFTVKGDALYAIIVGKWPGASILISSLAQGQSLQGKITSVTMLGSKGQLTFSQNATGLKVNLPSVPPCDAAYVLKITGLKMNSPTWTATGNPINK